MIKKTKEHQLKILGISFAFLLIYIIAGFATWFFELESQNRHMYRFRLMEIRADDPEYFDKVLALQDAKKRKTFQYIGEGSTFLLVLLAGAVYVYWNTRQQLLLSRKQQNFMMAVTHELKTPIAITKLNLETVIKRNLDDQKRNKLLGHSLDETKRLESLVNNILTASQLESGVYSLNTMQLNWSESVEKAANHFTLRYAQPELETTVAADVYIHGESQLLDLVLNNFLDNARKYSGKDSIIRMELTKDTSKNLAVLSIKDEGIGIKDEEKTRIFEKFYRVGNESTRTTKGTGLGLYLCQKIVTDHKGRIIVQDNQPHGTIFTIQLPLSKDSYGQ